MVCVGCARVYLVLFVSISFALGNMGLTVSLEFHGYFLDIQATNTCKLLPENIINHAN